MTNVIYPKAKESLLQAGINLSSGSVKAAVLTSAYTYSAAHQYWSSANSAVLGTPQAVGAKTFTNGLFDGNDVVFSALAGGTVTQIVIFVDTGVAATSPLICLFDSGVGSLPLVTDGTDTTTTWSGSGIFQL